MRVKSKSKLAVLAVVAAVLLGTCLHAVTAFGALDVSGAKSIAKGGSGEADWKAAPNNGRYSTWDEPGSGFSVPPEYANKLKKASGFRAESFGKTCSVQSLKDLYSNPSWGPDRTEDTHFCFDLTQNSKGSCGIWLRNLAIYDNEAGKDVKLDCKLTLMNWEDEKDNTPQKHHVYITKTRALVGVDIAGLDEVRLNWEYYRAGTNTPYKAKTNVTFNDIDSTQYMGFQVDQVAYQFVHPSTALKFKSQSGYSLYTDPVYGNDETMDSRQAFGVAYESDNVTYTFGTRTGGTFSYFGELAYSMFIPTPNDPTKTVSDSDETGQKQVLLSSLNETITYNVQQEVANGYAPASYMNKFIMEDRLEDCLEILSAKVQQNGADTDLFTVETNGQTVRAQAKAAALKTAAFYNKRYNLIITARIKAGTTLEQLSAYKKGDMIAIPNQGTVTIDDTPRITNEVEVQTWEAKPGKKVSDSDEKKVLANTIPSRLEPFVYTISQNIPQAVDTLSRLEFSDNVESCLDVKKVRVLENDEDVSSRWNISSEGNHVTASASGLGEEAAGKTYTLEITVQIKDVSDETLQDHGHYSGDKKKLIFKNTGSMAYRLADGEEVSAKTNQVTTNVRLPVDIGITKTVNRYEHQVGDPIHYTVRVSHQTDGCEATDLVVRDTDLENFELDLQTAKVTGVADYTLKQAVGGWELTTLRLAKGQVLTIEFTARAKKILNGTIAPNIARVKCFGLSEKSDAEEVYINSPKLKVTKETDRNHYKIGDTIDYTLELSQINKGCFMRDVILTDEIQTEGVKIMPGTIIVLDKNGKNVTPSMDVTIKDRTFTIETKRNFSDKSETVLPKEQGKEPYRDLELTGYLKVCYSAKIASDSLSDKVIVNRAELPSRPNTNDEMIKNDPDIPSGGAEEEHKAPIAAAELRIEKSSDKKQYQVGETGLYTVKVEQIREDDTAENVVIQDAFEKEGMIVDRENLKVFYDRTDITKSCNLQISDTGYEIQTGHSLPYGHTMTVTYPVKFAAKTLKNTELTNVALTKADNAKEKETDYTVSIGDVPVSVEIEKTSDKKEYEPKEPIGYTLKVTSTGTYKAENVAIKDELKTKGVVLEADSICVRDQDGTDITKSCQIEAGETAFLIKTGRDLEPGQYLIVTYTAYADESLAGKQVDNTAVTQAEGTKEKKVDHTVNIVDTSAGLQVLKETDKSHYKPEEAIIYTLTVTSKGPSPAKNVIIQDEIKTKGVILDSDCITVQDDKGTNITKACHIETTEQSFLIRTGRDLDAGRWLRVTYKAEAGESLSGKEVENQAKADADNSDPAEDDHTVIIDPQPTLPAETKQPSEPEKLTNPKPSEPEEIHEGLTLSPEKEVQEGLKLSKEPEHKKGTGSVQTGDQSSIMFYVILATMAAAVVVVCLMGKKKKKHRRSRAGRS